MKKIFVLGLPGCGKSTVARSISKYLWKQNVWFNQFNDYTILNRLFHDEQLHPETKSPRFHAVDNGGFYIVKREVCDEALKLLRKQVDSCCTEAELIYPKGVVVVEFARNNYFHAFKQLQLQGDNPLHDACVLFLNASVSTCRKRVRERIASPQTEDDYFVSDYTFEFYYGKDTEKYLQEQRYLISRQFDVAMSRIEIISTDDAWEDVEKNIHHWLETTLYRDLQLTCKLPDTGPLRPQTEDLCEDGMEIREPIED